MALITAAEARVFIPSLTGTTDDTELDTLIVRADALMAAWCGWGIADGASASSFEDATYTEYHDGPTENGSLALRVRPVVSVTTIHDDSDWSYSTLVGSSDYTTDLRAGRVWLNPTATHSWSSAHRAIRVVYVAGFATIPEEIKQATCLLVAHWWRLRSTQGRQSISKGTGSESVRAETLPRSVRELLTQHSRAEGAL